MRYLFMLLGAGAIVGLDQWTKYLTAVHIACRAYEVAGQTVQCAQAADLPQIIPVWDGVFHLTHYHNTGMAFSLLEGGRWLFLILTAAVLVLMTLSVLKKWLDHPAALTAMAMIAGGGVGNMIDRLLYGAVVDMIEVEFMHFAVFNVADSFVCIGAALLAVWAVFFDRKRPETPEEEPHDHPV